MLNNDFVLAYSMYFLLLRDIRNESDIQLPMIKSAPEYSFERMAILFDEDMEALKYNHCQSCMKVKLDMTMSRA